MHAEAKYILCYSWDRLLLVCQCNRNRVSVQKTLIVYMHYGKVEQTLTLPKVVIRNTIYRKCRMLTYTYECVVVVSIVILYA